MKTKSQYQARDSPRILCTCPLYVTLSNRKQAPKRTTTSEGYPSDWSAPAPGSCEYRASQPPVHGTVSPAAITPGARSLYMVWFLSLQVRRRGQAGSNVTEAVR
jgi:hypothetical protein